MFLFLHFYTYLLIYWFLARRGFWWGRSGASYGSVGVVDTIAWHFGQAQRRPSIGEWGESLVLTGLIKLKILKYNNLFRLSTQN